MEGGSLPPGGTSSKEYSLSGCIVSPVDGLPWKQEDPGAKPGTQTESIQVLSFYSDGSWLPMALKDGTG